MYGGLVITTRNSFRCRSIEPNLAAGLPPGWRVAMRDMDLGVLEQMGRARARPRVGARWQADARRSARQRARHEEHGLARHLMQDVAQPVAELQRDHHAHTPVIEGPSPVQPGGRLDLGHGIDCPCPASSCEIGAGTDGSTVCPRCNSGRRLSWNFPDAACSERIRRTACLLFNNSGEIPLRSACRGPGQHTTFVRRG